MIKIVQGSVLDCAEEYVVQQCDCISTVASGLDADYLAEFPWAEVYTSRTQMNGFRNLAVPDSRAKPGEIKVFDSGSDEDPKVIGIFSQFCPGRPFSGINAKKRFKDDTVENRISWFENCLKEITKLKPESIAFPDKIGVLRNNGDWEVYSDKLQEFADENPECHILLYSDVAGPRPEPEK